MASLYFDFLQLQDDSGILNIERKSVVVSAFQLVQLDIRALRALSEH